MCKTIEPESGVVIEEYDASNNLAWRAAGLALTSTTSCDRASVPAASKTSFMYDALNRLTDTTFGDGSPPIRRTYTYDSLPETTASNGTVWTNSYNKRRLLTRESLEYGGTMYNIDHGYDANAARSSLTYPDDSKIAYAPNALGEATQVGSFASNVSYHPNGAVSGFRYGNGIHHTMTQNVRGLPEWSIDGDVMRDNYVYDGNANVAFILDYHEGVSNRGMTYDNLDRLIRVDSATQWGAASYAYDALDNLTSTNLVSGATARATTHAYDTVTNLLTDIASNNAIYNLGLEYDTRGNVSRRGSQRFVFDQGNRMSSAVGKGTYVYDGAGRRVSTVGTDGVNRITVYSQQGKLLFFRATSTPMAAGVKYIHLGNHVIAESSPAGTVYAHTDGLGSPIATTDGNGALVSRTRYEPYGLTFAGASPTIGFSGHLNAADIGLVYMQQRYYDPVAGRFLSVDPVTTDANTGSSFNRYDYAINNPYKYIDPDGRIVETPWDAANVAWGVASLTRNIIIGNYVGAAFDVAGIGYDSFATAVPGLPGGAAAAIGASRAASTLANNAKVGAAFQSKVAANVAAKNVDTATEVTIKTASGVKTRMDIVARDAAGAVKCTECKATLSAPLTANQKIAHPEILQSGGVVVGAGKPGFPGGTVIPAQIVDVVRP
ncbi:RHS repeat domain-containing protein [Massilia soli]|uniref:RHS repeat-associated core domain-containing protein n=1 Tax=Massilia soli TaxID=2792854 RepID=A0ABS7SI92_9BURK|nr:RHS repeat-associated core domain-containing protein [Massilia soli]MBZ2205927.1 RHS repeat-associated core domain-containing protein [Massilia soli]